MEKGLLGLNLGKEVRRVTQIFLGRLVFKEEEEAEELDQDPSSVNRK